MSQAGTEEQRLFVPSRERARAEGLTGRRRMRWLPFGVDLLASEPDEEIALATVIVEAKVLAREVRDKTIQVPARLLAGMSAAPFPVPTELRAKLRQQLLERAAEQSDCATCEYPRGKVSCTSCGGRGKVLKQRGENTVVVPCPACQGGYVACPTCEGEGAAFTVRVREAQERVHELHYAYVPTMVDALEIDLGTAFDRLPPLPACLRFDPLPERQSSAYRGERGEIDKTFLGHAFGDALTRATRAIAGLGAPGEALLREVRTYAWPLLWLRYRSIGRRGEVALYVMAGKVQVVVAPG
jgi:hypothetical protein